MIESFDKCRKYIDGQYPRIYSNADVPGSESLYAEIKAIYDAEEKRIIGKGKALKHFLLNTKIYINPHDIFADIIYNENTPRKLRKDTFALYHKKAKRARELSRLGAIEAFPDFGHTMPDWHRLLTLGFAGVRDEAKERLSRAADDEKRAFYTSVIDAYDGIIGYTERLADAAELEGSVNSLFAAESLRGIKDRAPRTLAEAMQFYFVYYSAQHFADGAVLRSLGSLDLILYPFYKRDIENGADEGYVRELIRYFLFKWNSMRVEANIPFDLGMEPNRLTYLIIEEYVKLDVHDPKIHFIVKEDTPKELILTFLRSVRDGKNSIVFISDSAVRASLERIGISKTDAQSYTLIGCYEPSAVGTELPCTLNGRVNLPMALESVLRELKDSGRADEIGFDELLSLVRSRILEYVNVAIDEINTVEEKYPLFMHSPTLSGSYEPCMESGKDIYAGGAKYNNSSVCAFGLATLTDSLTAIKRVVFTDKKRSLSDLCLILENNWEGEAVLRKTVRSYQEKYGRGNADADEIALDIWNFLSDNINGRKNGRGGVYRLGMFSIDWIFKYGRLLGASADGRFAGDPLSKNLSPSVGMDIYGITSVMRSVMKFDHTKCPDGNVLDLPVHPTAVMGEEGLSVFYALLETYISGGGFAIQFNVLDPETLRKAQISPEKYKNLQVRLCGWNVLFTNLDKTAQDNLIASMEKAE